MKKVKVLSVMLWVTLSLVAATYVGCKNNNQEVKQEEVVSDSTAVQSDTTVIDTVK